MAIVSRSSLSNWIFPLKVLLISASVCFLAVVLKLSLPVILDFLISQLPLLWTSLRSWLRPPYLYFVINGIILTIAASSRFQQKLEERQPELVIPVPVKSELVVSVNPVSVSQPFDYDIVVAAKDVVETTAVYGQREFSVTEVKSSLMSASEEEDDDDDDGLVISRSTWIPKARESTEKPLVYVRFSHRKNVKSSPEAGRALGVAKSKRNDTLESTWKTITDGRSIPLARHLKKSETWDTLDRHNNGNISNSGPPEAYPVKMKKSETFKDRSSNTSSLLSPAPGSEKLRREASLGQDELNRRVEAFIKKFNEEMMLQRQESLNQYKEMINRGAGPKPLFE